MARPVSGKIRTTVARVKQKNGDIYVYERQTRYDPAAGYTRILSSELLGKIPAGTSEMVPTRPRKSPKNSAKAAENGLARETDPAGLSGILDWIGEKSGIDHDLGLVFGEETAAMLIAIARMRLAEGSFSYRRFEKWQRLHGSPCGSLPVTEGRLSGFFDRLGEHEALFREYFRVRAARCKNSPLAAMDTTSRPEETDEADELSLLRLLTVCSMTSGQPVAFVRLHDELKEAAVLEAGFKELGRLGVFQKADGSNPGAFPGSFPVVTDMGLSDASLDNAGNVALYVQQNISFVSGISLDTPWVHEALEAHRADLNKSDSFFLQDRLYKACTVIAEQDFHSAEGRDAAAASKEQKKARLYLHFFFDSTACSSEKAALQHTLDVLGRQIEEGICCTDTAQSLADRFLIVSKGKNKSVQRNEKALLEEQKDYGIFCLVSDTEEDPRKALRCWLERCDIESFFSRQEERPEGRHVPSLSMQASAGYLFAQFVALGYSMYFQEALQRVLARLSGECRTDDDPDRTLDDGLNDDLKENLKDWLLESSAVEVLDLFDGIERVRLRTSQDSAWKETDREEEQTAGLLEALLKEEAPCL